MEKINIIDHSVSKEQFELIYNSEFDMFVTSPKPLDHELEKYYETEDYISHTDAKRNLLEKVYHWVRSYSIQKKIKLINSQSEKRKLLDIGCGTGDFLKAAELNGWDVLGIEPNVNARTIASSKLKTEVLDTSELLNLPEQSFDVITLWHVLEHLPKLETHVTLLKKLLSPNGTLIIAVPNYKSYDAQYYKSYWAAYDVPRHLWHFSQNSIAKLFDKEEMQVVETLPMKFDAFYVSLLSEKYRSGSMNPLKAFYIGLQSNMKAKASTEYSSLIYVIKNSNN